MKRPASKKLDEFLLPTRYCDSNNPAIKNAALSITKSAGTPKDAAIAIFKFVRDEILFAMDEHATASETLRRGTGQCATKSGLQIALLRAANIPARYHVADVHKNCLKGMISAEAFDAFDEIITDHYWCECNLSRKWFSCEAFFDSALYDAGVGQGIICREEMPAIEWDGESDLVVLKAWMVKDKGTYSELDTQMDREKEEMAEFWPVLRKSNRFTVSIRSKGTNV